MKDDRKTLQERQEYVERMCRLSFYFARRWMVERQPEKPLGENLSPRNDNVGWTFGCWGQLVTARGTFNPKAGKFAREKGVLK